MKQQVIFNKIVKARLVDLKPNNQKKKIAGILIGGIFYDLTKELNRRTNQTTIQQLLKKSDIILNPLTEKPMQIICSYKDLEEIKSGAS